MWRPAYEDELGVLAPVGYCDPLDLAMDGDADGFYRRRWTEIKLGRVSMIASIGYNVPEYFKWDGYESTYLKLQFKDQQGGEVQFKTNESTHAYYATVGHIQLKVMDQQGTEAHFKIKPSTYVRRETSLDGLAERGYFVGRAC